MLKMNDYFVVSMFGAEFGFSRVAFQIGNFSIYWYGIFLATGFLAALIYAFRRAADFKIKTDPMIDVVLVGAIGSIVCARAYYVLTSLENYHSFKEAISIHDGGIAIYGAIIGAFVFGGLMCKIRKINILSMFDLASIGFLIGQAVGRWGNFVNQEAFGRNTSLPWGMYSETTNQYLSSSSVQSALISQGVTNIDPSAPVHPCFLYESIWCLIGFVLLHFLSKHTKFKGETFLQYIVWYGFGRFFIEGLRTDSLMLGNVKISQLVAGICVIAGVAVIAIVRLKINAKNKPDIFEEAAEE